MTFLAFTLAAMALASPQAPCSLPKATPGVARTFTNADLELMSACRYQTGVESEVGHADEAPASPGKTGRRTKTSTKSSTNRGGAVTSDSSAAEADWRAQWRSVDQKARRLRNEAQQLRQEAAELPRDPKKKVVTGRRSPSLLESKALTLEAEARELEDEFQQRARREGALPGWLRPKVR